MVKPLPILEVGEDKTLFAAHGWWQGAMAGLCFHGSVAERNQWDQRQLLAHQLAIHQETKDVTVDFDFDTILLDKPFLITSACQVVVVMLSSTSHHC